MADLETDVPLIRSYVAKFAALGVTEGVVALAELSEPMENGAFYPLFLLCLQQIHKLKDKDWLVSAFNDSKVNLQMMLPGNYNPYLLICLLTGLAGQVVSGDFQDHSTTRYPSSHPTHRDYQCVCQNYFHFAPPFLDYLDISEILLTGFKT